MYLTDTWCLFQFGGFSADSLAERMADCQAKVLITADGAWRGEKPLPLKSICDAALDKCSKNGHNVETCIVVAHLNRVTFPTNHVFPKVLLLLFYFFPVNLWENEEKNWKNYIRVQGSNLPSSDLYPTAGSNAAHDI